MHVTWNFKVPDETSRYIKELDFWVINRSVVVLVASESARKRESLRKKLT